MMKYYACMPRSSGPPDWTLTNLRVEKAKSPQEATLLAFGRGKMPVWVKDLGSRIAVVHSTAKLRSLVHDRVGWIDPWKGE